MTLLLHDNQVGGREKHVPIDTLVGEFIQTRWADPALGLLDRRFLVFLAEREDEDGCIYFGRLSDEQWEAIGQAYRDRRAPGQA